ncbi:MAG TPA: SPOR domain-containing protein [Rhodanobacteraceae bacterium]
MFLRLLLLLLLAMNIGVGCWLAFGQRPQPLPPATDPGVPELQLLPAVPTASARVVADAHAIKASGRCLRIGPFDTRSGMQQAFEALTPHVPQIQYQRDQVTKPTGWWVYLPAFSTEEQALAAARTLAGEGIQDYYVITAGDRQNTVSLGLFHDQDNAKRRLARIQQLGYHAKLTQRMETLPEYWVAIALPAAKGFDWHAWVQAPGAQAHAVDCF